MKFEPEELGFKFQYRDKIYQMKFLNEMKMIKVMI